MMDSEARVPYRNKRLVRLLFALGLTNVRPTLSGWFDTGLLTAAILIGAGSMLQMSPQPYATAPSFTLRPFTSWSASANCRYVCRTRLRLGSIAKVAVLWITGPSQNPYPPL
jgi:hypothetical protein